MSIIRTWPKLNKPHNGVDDRLERLVTSDNSFYMQLVHFPPSKLFHAPEPKALDFLFFIQGFHLRNMPSSRVARTPRFYDSLVKCFVTLTKDLEKFMTQNFYHQLTSGDGEATDAEKKLITAFYTKYGIYSQYPLENFVYRLYTVAAVILRYPRAHMQKTGLDSLPYDLVYLLASYLPSLSVLNLARVSFRYRDMLSHRFQRDGFFTVCYDHAVSRNHAWRSERFINVVNAAVNTARMECTSTVVDLINDARARSLIQFASFHNQWETLFPLHTSVYAAEPLDNEVFGELFAAIAWLLYYTQLRHLRLSGVGLPRRLIPHLASHVALQRLTLESCILEPIMIASAHPQLRMLNITHLTIGFGGTPRSNSMECWSVVLYCTNLHHLFVYPVEDSNIVHYPSSALYRQMPHLHRLRKLHVQGGSSLLRPLASWIRLAGDSYAHASSGALTHFKLNTVIGTTDDELSILLDALSTFHPNLRVLALEGVVDTAPAIARIAYEFPQLEGLSIVRKMDVFQKTVRLCQWDLPAYAIAQSLGALTRLQHFAANLDYTRLTFGPAAFHSLAYPALEAGTRPRPVHADSIDAILYEHLFSPSRYKTADEKAACLALAEKRDQADSLLDGLSIVRPFAAYCASLTSFAIKTDKIAFSCHIARDRDGNTSLYDVIDRDVERGFESWNPVHFESWKSSD